MSQRRLAAAISKIEEDNANQMRKVQREHRRSLDRMEEQQKALEVQITKVKADAVEQEEKYRKEMEDSRQREEAQEGRGNYR